MEYGVHKGPRGEGPGPAPRAEGAVYIKNLSNDMKEAMRMKQGLSSDQTSSLYQFWVNTIWKQDIRDPYGDLKKTTYKKPKPRLGEKAREGKTKLEIYEELKNLYGDLWGMDVKYTLAHDEWKANIEKEADDEKRVTEFESREKKR